MQLIMPHGQRLGPSPGADLAGAEFGSTSGGNSEEATEGDIVDELWGFDGLPILL
jgi:hypothetical protein